MTTLNIRKGVDWAMQWPVLDAEGEPADVSDWTLWGQVRPSVASETVLLEWSEENGNVELGEGFVRILVPYADSLDWMWSSGYYDVLLTSPDDERTYIDGGSVRVASTVTRLPVEEE